MSSTLSTPVILNLCLLLSSAMPNTIIPPKVLAKELTVSQNDLGNFQLASLYSMFSFSDGVLKLPVCVIALKFKKSI